MKRFKANHTKGQFKKRAGKTMAMNLRNPRRGGIRL